MGRRKIEIKRIENKTNQRVTFSKRRKGLLKKAHELAVLCDAQIGLVIFSCTGKMFEFSSQDTSLAQIIDRYQRTTNIRIEEIDYQKQLVCEMTRMKSDHDRLQAWMRQYLGEDLSCLNMHELDQVLEKLDCAVKKIRSRKGGACFSSCRSSLICPSSRRCSLIYRRQASQAMAMACNSGKDLCWLRLQLDSITLNSRHIAQIPKFQEKEEIGAGEQSLSSGPL